MNNGITNHAKGNNPMIVIYALLIYLFILISLTSPIVIMGSGLVHWRPLDFLALVLPFALWLALLYFWVNPAQKYWTNVLVEPMAFGIAVPVAAIIRLAVGDKVAESVCSASLIALLCLLAAGLALFLPPLPE